MTDQTNQTNQQTMNVASMPGVNEWHENPTIVLMFARILDELGAFFETSAVIDYFAKTQKWNGEYERWIKLGAPIERRIIIAHTNYILNDDAAMDCACGGEPNKTCGGLACQNWREG